MRQAVLVVLLAGCGNGDDFAVGRATGMFAGIDGILGGQCTCRRAGADEFTLFEGEIHIECLKEWIYLDYPEGHRNVTLVGSFSTLTGWGGTAIYEVGSDETTEDGVRFPLWIDTLYAPAAEEYCDFVGDCAPFPETVLEDGRAWCAGW